MEGGKEKGRKRKGREGKEREGKGGKRREEKGIEGENDAEGKEG